MTISKDFFFWWLTDFSCRKIFILYVKKKWKRKSFSNKKSFVVERLHARRSLSLFLSLFFYFPLFLSRLSVYLYFLLLFERGGKKSGKGNEWEKVKRLRIRRRSCRCRKRKRKSSSSSSCAEEAPRIRGWKGFFKRQQKVFEFGFSD